jgi:hypothetical protein
MESPPSSLRDRDLLRRWAETWRRAEVELEPIRQIFGEQGKASQPSPVTSGLVEQQAWFARLRGAKER